MTAGVLLGLALLLATVGGVYLGVGAYQRAQQEERRAERAAAEREAAEAETAAIEDCQDEVGEYVDKLRAIESRYFGVGINLLTFAEMLGAASDLRSRIDLAELTGECESVVDVADVAADNLALANSEWDDCVWEDLYCDVDSLDLSPYFGPAHNAVDEAWNAMREGREAVDVGYSTEDG